MRMKQSRVQTYSLKKRKPLKDAQGGTYEDYGPPAVFHGESWPAGGKVQAELYGERLSYIRNVKIQGEYRIMTDDKSRVHYIFENGLDVMEMDGICLYVPGDVKPDYKIIAVKPYRPLRLECEKI